MISIFIAKVIAAILVGMLAQRLCFKFPHVMTEEEAKALRDKGHPKPTIPVKLLPKKPQADTRR